MYWVITGKKEDLFTGLEDGFIKHWGTGSTEIIASENSLFSFKQKIQQIESAWSLYPSNASAPCIDPDKCGLFEKIKNSSDDRMASLRYHAETPALSGITIVLSENLFTQANEILRLVLLSPNSLQFLISLYLPHIHPDAFYKGQVYFSNAINISVVPDPALRRGGVRE